MDDRTKKIISDFASNDMPAEVQRQFRRWLVENAEEPEVGEQLSREWNAIELGSGQDRAFEHRFQQMLRGTGSAVPENVFDGCASDCVAKSAVPENSTRPEVPENSAGCGASGNIVPSAAPEHAAGAAIPGSFARSVLPNIGSRPRLFMNSWRRIAAAIVLCCSVLGLGALGGRLLFAPDNGVYVVTGEDSKGRFVLPDGTQVWLNCNSRLFYPESFDANRREVRLEGEALFNVTHDASRPFRVRTSLMEVEVLGTVFDLKNYEDLDYAEVVLVSGSIRASCGSQAPMTLSPGDRLLTYRDSKKCVYERVDAGNYSRWMFEKQKLDEMPLDEIFVNLSRRYNVEFDIAPDVPLSPRLTLSLYREPLEAILDAISLVAPIRYRIHADRVSITRR